VNNSKQNVIDAYYKNWIKSKNDLIINGYRVQKTDRRFASLQFSRPKSIYLYSVINHDVALCL